MAAMGARCAPLPRAPAPRTGAAPQSRAHAGVLPAVHHVAEWVISCGRRISGESGAGERAVGGRRSDADGAAQREQRRPGDPSGLRGGEEDARDTAGRFPGVRVSGRRGVVVDDIQRVGGRRRCGGGAAPAAGAGAAGRTTGEAGVDCGSARRHHQFCGPYSANMHFGGFVLSGRGARGRRAQPVHRRSVHGSAGPRRGAERPPVEMRRGARNGGGGGGHRIRVRPESDRCSTHVRCRRASVAQRRARGAHAGIRHPGHP
eukprot:ctg_5284.g598